MSEQERNEERGAQPKGSTGMFGAKPMVMKPSTSVRPPTQGPKGSAGDSGASRN